MKLIFEKFNNFMRKQAINDANSSDSIENTVLLRECGIIYTLFFFIAGIMLGVANGFEFSVYAFIAAGLMTCAVICTYYTGSIVVTLTAAGIIVILSCFLDIQTAGACGMGLIIMSVVPLMFSSIRFGTKAKIFTGIAVCILRVATDIVIYFNIIPIEHAKKGTFVLLEFSQVVFVVIIMMVSYYFCKQYTQAEHQVYIINRQLKKMASLDPLTGLMNRRGMADVLPDMEYAYKAGTAGLSIAIGDIDFFKKVNDTYGHDCGDYVLKTVSAYFAKYMEDKGEICRWGGEEFLFAFHEKNADEVFVMLNDMRHTIKHMQFKFNDIEFNLTMTFGLEEYTPYAQLENTIKKADEKLYLGKESGRDKVVY